MARFEASRYAEALLDAAGPDIQSSLSILQLIADALPRRALQQRGQELPSGLEAGKRLDAALERAFAASAFILDRGAILARRLAVLLTRRSHLGNLELILDSLVEILDKKAGLASLELETAFLLDDEILDELRASLLHWTGARAVKIEERLDEELLGGIRVSRGWDRIDASLHRRLRGLAEATGASRSGGGNW